MFDAQYERNFILGATVNERSAFHAHNLDGALELVNQYANDTKKVHIRRNYTYSRGLIPGLPNHAKKTIYNSPVFMYTDLLPVCGFRIHLDHKPVFIHAEDNLIALGLEEFAFSSTPLYYIQNFLVPSKTERQITFRIQNSRQSKCSLDNPIKYYFTYRQAPPFPRTVRQFDPNDVKAPKDQPPETLPKWMRERKFHTDPSNTSSSLSKRAKLINTVILPQNNLFPIIIQTSLIPKRKVGRPANQKVMNAKLRKILPKPEKICVKNVVESVNLQSDIGTCVEAENLNFDGISIKSEVVDEVDKEIDDEMGSTHQNFTVTDNIINKRQSSKKKKNKQQNLESSLGLSQPNLIRNYLQKEQGTLFANSYLLRVTEALREDPDTQQKFLKTLVKYMNSKKSSVKIYLEMKEILKDYPSLAFDFIAFLHPEEAKNCGKYKEYITLSKIRAFFHEIEVHFSNDPLHLFNILRAFTQFKQQSSISSVDVLASLQPLLKRQSHLLEELTHLLSEMTSLESVNSCEEILTLEANEPNGETICPCECYTSSTEAEVGNKTWHCIKCGVKFKDRKLCIQTENILKLAQVVKEDVFLESSKPLYKSKSVMKRKYVRNCSRGAKNTVVAKQHSKPEISQTKVKTVTSVIQSPLVLSDESIQSTSKLPCDITEDVVFTSLPVSQCKNNASDFNQLKKMKNDKDCSPNEKSTSLDNHKEAVNSTEQINPPQASVEHGKAKWTSEEDKIIIYNCQVYGITEKAFEISTSTLKSKTLDQVQERFVHLMNLLSKGFES